MTETIQKAGAERLLAQMRELQSLYGGLLELTRAQCEAGGASGNMADVLARKQSVMRRIDAVGLDFASMRERWDDVRETLPEDERTEAAEIIKSLQATLRLIIEMENRWQSDVMERKTETLDQIRKLQGGRRVARAYGAPAKEPDPRFLDRTE